MPSFSLEAARPLGAGQFAPAGAVIDPDLATLLRTYRRRVVGTVFSFTPAEVDTFLPRGPLDVSPSVDGAPWSLVLGDGEPFLAGPRGEIIAGELPLLVRARGAGAKVSEKTVVAGQLFAEPSSGAGRPRADELAALLASGEAAEGARLGFVGHDLLLGGDGEGRMPLGPYDDRARVVARLLGSGGPLRAARVERAADASRVLALFRELVEGGPASSLLLRSTSGRLLRLAPPLSFDVVVVGFSVVLGAPSEVGAMLLAMTRPGGQQQLVGVCSQLGDEASRRALHAQLAPLVVPSSYRHVGAHGELFRLVSPQLKARVSTPMVRSEDSSSRPERSATLSSSKDGWSLVALSPTAHLVAPTLIELLGAKAARTADTRLSNVLERAFVPAADQAVVSPTLGQSHLLRREVWVKEHRGQKAVRKLVAWKTNKEGVDPSYPPYVVHWTDYSPGRKQPLDREVLPAGSIDALNTVADRLIAEHIKKGWQKVS